MDVSDYMDKVTSSIELIFVQKVAMFLKKESRFVSRSVFWFFFILFFKVFKYSSHGVSWAEPGNCVIDKAQCIEFDF